MADLVRVRVGGYEKNVGRAYAEAQGLEVLDEPTRTRSGALRPTTRRKGRPVKSKTSISAEVEKKKKAAVTESAPTEKEQNR